MQLVERDVVHVLDDGREGRAGALEVGAGVGQGPGQVVVLGRREAIAPGRDRPGPRACAAPRSARRGRRCRRSPTPPGLERRPNPSAASASCTATRSLRAADAGTGTARRPVVVYPAATAALTRRQPPSRNRKSDPSLAIAIASAARASSGASGACHPAAALRALARSDSRARQARTSSRSASAWGDDRLSTDARPRRASGSTNDPSCATAAALAEPEGTGAGGLVLRAGRGSARRVEGRDDLAQLRGGARRGHRELGLRARGREDRRRHEPQRARREPWITGRGRQPGRELVDGGSRPPPGVRRGEEPAQVGRQVVAPTGLAQVDQALDDVAQPRAAVTSGFGQGRLEGLDLRDGGREPHQHRVADGPPPAPGTTRRPATPRRCP